MSSWQIRDGRREETQHDTRGSRRGTENAGLQSHEIGAYLPRCRTVCRRAYDAEMYMYVLLSYDGRKFVCYSRMFAIKYSITNSGACLKLLAFV